MLNLVDIFINKLSQVAPIDPNAVQPGQSVYNLEGEEYIILENDPATTDKVLMPAEDKGKEVPEGATSIDDYEFSTTYQVQPVQSVQAAIEKEFVKGSKAKSNAALIFKAQNLAKLDGQNLEQNQKLSQVSDNLIEGLNLDNTLDKTPVFENSKSGYSAIKALVEDMIDSGYSDLDIMIAVGENFDRELSQRVLADLRTRGIF